MTKTRQKRRDKMNACNKIQEPSAIGTYVMTHVYALHSSKIEKRKKVIEIE